MKRNVYTFKQLHYYRTDYMGYRIMAKQAAKKYVLPSMRVLMAIGLFFGIILGACAFVEANWGKADKYLSPTEAIRLNIDQYAVYSWTIPGDAMVYDLCYPTQIMASQLRVRKAPSIDAEINKQLRRYTDVLMIAYYNGWVLVSESPRYVPIGWVSARYLNGGAMAHRATIPMSEVLPDEPAQEGY